MGHKHYEDFPKQKIYLKLSDITLMAPTVLREGPFRLFFFSREEARMHIHVSHTDGEAKFWLEPKIELAMNQGLNTKQLGIALLLIEQHHEDIIYAWHIHFGN